MCEASWKRFILACSNDYSTPPLNSLPADWSRLSETSLHLLHSCPPSRPALLEYHQPIVRDFLQSCYSDQADQGLLPANARRRDGPKRKRQRFSRWPAAENYIIEFLQNALEVCDLELEAGVSGPKFSANLCLWALDLLAGIAPPPQRDVLLTSRLRHPSGMPSSLNHRRPLYHHHHHHHHHHNRQRERRKHRRQQQQLPNSSSLLVDADSREVDDDNDNGGFLKSDTAVSSTDGENEPNDLDDDLEKMISSPTDDEGTLEDQDEYLDLRASEFNTRLLGNWIVSPVVQKLLRIVFSCLMGKYASLSSAQSLITASLPPMQRKRGPPVDGPHAHGDPGMCQPHWCTNWLLYQASGLPGQESLLAVQRLVDLLLEAVLRGPPNNSPYNPDYHRSWAVTSIANTLFLGPSVKAHVQTWLSTRLTTLVNEQSSQPTMLHLVVPLGVLNVKGQGPPQPSSTGEDCGPAGFIGPRPSGKQCPPGLHDANYGILSGNRGNAGPWWNAPIPPAFPQSRPPHAHFPPHHHRHPNNPHPYHVKQPQLHRNPRGNPAIHMATSLFSDLPTDRPEFRYLHALCTSLRGACLSTLVSLLKNLLIPSGKLVGFIESHLGCLPPSEVDLFKDVLIDALLNAPVDCGVQWIELLLNLAEAGPNNPKSVIFFGRSTLKSLVNRALQSISFQASNLESEDEIDLAESTSNNFFQCIDQLATSTEMCSVNITPTTPSPLPLGAEGGYLMHRLITKACFASGQLLILRSLQSKRYTAEQLFSNLICWNLWIPGNEQSESDTRILCPLPLLFPLLRDWERCQLAAAGGVSGSLGHRVPLAVDLLRVCLARVFRVIITNIADSAKKRALLNLLWLWEREDFISAGSPDGSKPFKVALAGQIHGLVYLLPKLKETGSMSLGLDLCERVCRLSKCREPLSPKQAVSCSRRLVSLLVKLLTQLEQTDCVEQFALLIHTIKRVDDLLNDLAAGAPLVRSTALVSFAVAAVHRSNSPTTGTNSGPTKQQELCDGIGGTRMPTEPTCLPTEFLLHGDLMKKPSEGSRSAPLLLSCPPATVPEKAVRGAVRGQLVRRQPLPGLGKESETENYFWSPIKSLWTKLVTRLIDGSTRMRHLFGMALEDVLLPLGTRLPQTCITSLPCPLFLVTPPTGLGLERTLNLLRAFLGETTSSSQKVVGDETGRGILWSLLELVLDQRSQEKKFNSTLLEDPWTLPPVPCGPLPLLPCIRVVIGLLAGLEVQWASSLAPRLSVHAALQANSDGTSTPLGIFPLVGTPGVAIQRTRRLIIELSHRCLDTSTEFYRATVFLLSLLLQQPAVTSTTDLAVPKETEAVEEEGNPYPAPPLECLLSRLTPRELATCLSDIRRNLRLRACLDWPEQNGASNGQHHGLTQPPPFLTTGLLVAVFQSHLVESGISDSFGGLLVGLIGRQSFLSSGQSSTARYVPGGSNSQQRIAAVIDGNNQLSALPTEHVEIAEGIEEVNLGGEMVVVLDS